MCLVTKRVMAEALYADDNKLDVCNPVLAAIMIVTKYKDALCKTSLRSDSIYIWSFNCLDSDAFVKGFLGPALR